MTGDWMNAVVGLGIFTVAFGLVWLWEWFRK